MKKFYTSLFTAVFLLVSFLSQGQVFNSILTNPNNYTLDDPRFWQGGIPPGNPCVGCIIKIFSNVTVVQGGGGTTSTANVFTTQVPTDLLGHQDGANLITVGMKFQSFITTNVTGVRFYKLPNMAGPHTGLLYHAGGGAPLASITFTGETASGWQDMKFTTPVAITANTTYIIAVFMGDGLYTSNVGGLSAAITNGIVTATADNPPGGDRNGLFAYGATPTFPTGDFNGSNYWVDVDVSVDGTFLNNVLLSGSTINVYGNTNLTVNTYLRLTNGSNITIGNDPTSTESILINDQIDVDASSSLRLANANTLLNANNDALNPIIGPHPPLTGAPGNGLPKTAGLYGLLSAPIGGFNYTYILNGTAIGTKLNNFANYTLNCTGTPPNLCAAGLVYGPAVTGPSPGPTDFGVIFGQAATLPVVLAKFVANKNADGSVKLDWSTSQEVNAGYYDIERSGDQTGWTKIGSVKAKGNSSTTTNYNYTDRLPLDVVSYYRLKMVDLDGKFVYSKTITVTAEKNNVPLVIYSNPFTDQIRLKVNVSRSQNLSMTVSDIQGKTYIRQSFQAKAGDNLVNLPSNIGGSGIYILHINGDSYNQTVKLEKQ